ncbi:MAG: tetratricopeptide repeat protein [Prevotella histicola]|uniref:tetratricopeptide repeat protein n=1 Tax=Prevotella histicola TaxID=470565 RepID=UPI001CAD76AC|nr:tetratricopeptide repeat protein [Prevotella histicola]MBF1425842.1 tetratricopeptide repeat protein [Prevotella histicola]
MNVDEILSSAINNLMDKRLDLAIDLLEQLYVQRPTLIGHSELEAVKNDYQLMVDYMERGFTDDKRASLYLSLLQRLYRVAADLEISWRCKNVIVYVDAFRISDHLNTSHDFIRSVLESFVSDVAMLSLLPEAERTEKAKDLYDRHQVFVNRLFNTLWTSCQWSDDDCEFYAGLMLSPMVDVVDQQLLVSAVTLGAMNQFDINKFKALTTVYQQSTDERVRQRALVGWVLSVFEGMDIFPEQDEIIRKLCENKDTIRELYTLQIQFFYSQDTEKDNEKLQRDIMPYLVEGSNITIGRLGIVEKEEDSLENILNQDAEDKRMEQMEEKVRKMMEMQKQGSDIYFGGFRQMKRFPFFNDLANWFTPFYIDHPALRTTIERIGQPNILETITNQGNFCESDKYSLAFAMESIINQIPGNIKEMMGSEGAFAPMGTTLDKSNPTYICRAYIQDLYRFFRLYRSSNELINPFIDNHKSSFVADTFFFVYKSFIGTGLDEYKMRLALYLYKHKNMDKLVELMSTFHVEDANYNILMGYINLYFGKPDVAYQIFNMVLQEDTENQWALKGMARAAMDCEDYDTAEHTYSQLLRLEPDNINYAVKRCVTFLKTERYAEAREELFRLDYQYPDNMNVKRVFAWTMLLDKSLDKASQLYDLILSDAPMAEDYLNSGYCWWAKGNIGQAKNSFQAWITMTKGNKDRLLEEIRNDQKVLDLYGITEIDCLLMVNLIK